MKTGGLILVGASVGVLGWLVYRGAQGAAVDTADGEAGGYLAGVDDFMDVAYKVSGAIVPGRLEISLAGLSLIKRVEGFSSTVYSDSVGYPTIGYGHKLTAVERAQGLSYVTEAQAAQLLAGDVADAEIAVNRLVKVALSQNQFDALVSFVYNVGAGAFSRSTMLRRLNAGDYAGAAAQFSVWVYAGGQRVAGLVNRRTAEAKFFNGQGVATA